MTAFLVVTIILVNVLIGVEVISLLDHKDERYMNWIKKDPTGVISFFCFLFWPIFIYLMLRKEK